MARNFTEKSRIVRLPGGMLALRLVLTDGGVKQIELAPGTTWERATALLRSAVARVLSENLVSAGTEEEPSQVVTEEPKTTADPKPKGRGRPRTGKLEFRNGTWHVRTTVTIGGRPVRQRFDLDTSDRELAERKRERLLLAQDSAEAAAQAAARGETYADLAARVAPGRRVDVADAYDEEARERLWILPVIGQLAISEIRPKHILEVYDRTKAKGKSVSHLRHLRTILRHRFARAVAEELIPSSPVDGVAIPRGTDDDRERAVLTDAELAIYLGWQHPWKGQQDAVRERQTMSVLARTFGGLRTGDLHGAMWEHFDTQEGAFTWGKALRRKTRRPQTITIPEMLRPILRDWWERSGRPSTGPLFPSRRGPNKGQAKSKASHADALRRDLQAAFLGHPAAPQPGSPRWVELFEETELTRPVDFHSWRRAFVQALAMAGVNAQTAQKLSGHADLAAHERYLRSSALVLEIPEGAVPAVAVAESRSKTPSNDRSPEAKNLAFPLGSWSGWRDLNAQPPAPKGGRQSVSAENTDGLHPAEPSESPRTGSSFLDVFGGWPKTLAENPHARSRLADAQLAAVLGATAGFVAERLVGEEGGQT